MKSAARYVVLLVQCNALLDAKLLALKAAEKVVAEIVKLLALEAVLITAKTLAVVTALQHVEILVR